MEPTSVPGPRGPRDRPRATPVLGQVQVQNPRRIRRAPENRNGRILKTGGSVLVARVHLAYPARGWSDDRTWKACRPADPRDKEIAKLRTRLAKVEGQLDKANKIIEIQGKLSALLD